MNEKTARVVVRTADRDEIVRCFLCAASIRRLTGQRSLLIEWGKVPAPSDPLCGTCLAAWEGDLGQALMVAVAAIEQEARGLSPWSRMLLEGQARRLSAEHSNGIVVEAEAQLWADELTGIAATFDGGRPCLEIA